MPPIQHTITTPYVVGPVHCYSLEINGELLLFDCGPPTEECRRQLHQQIELSKLRHLILTHAHIDHWGQALWLAEKFGVKVYMPYHDHLKILYHEKRLSEIQHIMSAAGFSEQWLEEFANFVKKDALYPNFPTGYAIAEEEVTQQFGIEVYRCAGHSVSDLVYKIEGTEKNEGWIISGDTLLPGIFQSPLLDVDLENGGRFLNYETWCDSIITLARLEGNRVLPGHRNESESACAILLWYLRTLLYRLKRFLPYRNEESFAEIVKIMLADRIQGPFHIYFKASEMIFLQDLLTEPKRLIGSLIKIKEIMAKKNNDKKVTELKKIITRFQILLDDKQ